MNNPPYYYDYSNMIDSIVSPSGVQVTNSATAIFFRRYLLQKAMSVFKWTFPKTWNSTYFLYTLLVRGHISIVETDKYGVICQGGYPYGLNVFFQPTNYTIANPLLRGILTPKIDKECVVFKLEKDWKGIGDLVSFYADYMALAAQSLGVNLINSKLSYLFAAENKTFAESFKKMFDKVASGEPAVVADSKLFGADGKLKMDMLLQNVGQSFIANDLLETWTTLENKFATAIGIPNANLDKKERMIVDEVNANNFETVATVDMWFDDWKETIEKAKNMFNGLDELDVEWRFDYSKKEGVKNENNGNNVDNGSV